jgi:hypothetical protein
LGNFFLLNRYKCGIQRYSWNGVCFKHKFNGYLLKYHILTTFQEELNKFEVSKKIPKFGLILTKLAERFSRGQSYEMRDRAQHPTREGRGGKGGGSHPSYFSRAGRTEPG